MKKLFYTDPLKAVWMAREFGVEYITTHYSGKIKWSNCCEFAYDLMDFFNIGEDGHGGTENNVLARYEVHPDSYEIFEPRVGDLVSVPSNGFDFCNKCNPKASHKYWVLFDNDPTFPIGTPVQCSDVKDMEILKRNGITFEMPERKEGCP
jgi:hypothetical protein